MMVCYIQLRCYDGVLYSWKIILEPMSGNVVISEIEALTYVVLHKTKKHMPYWELVGTTERTQNVQRYR